MDYLAVGIPKDIYKICMTNKVDLPSKLSDFPNLTTYSSSAVTRSQNGIKVGPAPRYDPSKKNQRTSSDPTETTFSELPEHPSTDAEEQPQETTMHHVDIQNIVEPTNQHNQDDASVHKAHGNSPPKKSSSNKNNTKDSMGQNNIVYLHLLFACRNQKLLELLSSKQNIIGFPRCRRNETYKCPICLKMKYGKIERNLLSSQIHLGPGQMFSMDFAFLNTTSVRGFSAYLSATCFTTAYPFGFPVCNKRAPLDLIRWLIDVMERQGRKVLFLRFDKGGKLARNYEVGKLLVENMSSCSQREPSLLLLMGRMSAATEHIAK